MPLCWAPKCSSLVDGYGATLFNTQEVTARALADARNHLSEVIEEVNRTHDRVTITRHGEPVAVVMAPADLAELEETLEIWPSPEHWTPFAPVRRT